ncbi:hypothetical protein Dvina_16730 [Dactylosporangium vinaceum]|uniref:DUF6959 family protein n=1 Tax=Dactylosporangium vinaceum TaxID=53362 RepID=A0ABV5M8Q0_9ACTN|nr:hypothetical protein [Dactylosporangium vinaceum]UAB99567.1 hypothetical protein Dvina_16730 [Dactylosporangium vinaceum]
MTDEQARVLARGGNIAVTWLDGRAFPGIHVQGDTFAGLCRQIAEAASRLRHTGGDSEASDDLGYAVEEMAGMVRFYESALAERDIRRPYHHDDAG